MSTAGRWRPGRRFRCGCSTPAARCGPRRSQLACSSRPPTECPAALTAMTPWRSHAAAEQGVEIDWVPQYLAGSRTPPAGRDRVRPELERRFEALVDLAAARD